MPHSEPAALLTDAAGPFDPEMKQAGQLTSPTWELELFLSGAFVFATFQLPGLIEALFTRLEPHATGASEYVLFTGALYAKAIAFTLIAMFSVHLVTRAYWVALMGLHSVFPDGIRWTEMKLGPIARGVYQSSVPTMSGVIARLDNFCSVIFSVGLLIVLVFIYSTALAAVFGGVSYVLAHTLGPADGMRYYFYVLAGLFVSVTTVTTLWDKRFGDRYSPDSRMYRTARGIIRTVSIFNATRLMGPMMWTLMTNVGRKRAMAFLYVTLMVLMMLAAADRLANSGRLTANTYDFFGESRTHGVSYRFYEDQHEHGKPYVRAPSIQSDMIRDPYVRLFIPYYPRRHNVALARACPGLRPLQKRGLQLGGDDVPDSLAVPVLDCMAKLHAVKLDGAPLTNLALSFYENPESGAKGVLGYIPADSLSRGKHLIEVTPVPPEELPTNPAARRAEAWKKPFVIPFWR